VSYYLVPCLLLIAIYLSVSTRGEEDILGRNFKAGKHAGSSIEEPEAKTDYMEKLRQNIPEEVVSTAEKGLVDWVYLISPITSVSPLSPEQASENLVLGIPYEQLYIDRQDVLSNDTLHEADVVARNEWLFPIKKRDRYIRWMIVRYKNGAGWKVSGVGGAGHAQKVEKIEEKIRVKDIYTKRWMLNVSGLDASFVVIGKEAGSFVDAQFYDVGNSDAVKHSMGEALSLLKNATERDKMYR
jgi:hypothetical protein